MGDHFPVQTWRSAQICKVSWFPISEFHQGPFGGHHLGGVYVHQPLWSWFLININIIICFIKKKKKKKKKLSKFSQSPRPRLQDRVPGLGKLSLHGGSGVALGRLLPSRFSHLHRASTSATSVKLKSAWNQRLWAKKSKRKTVAG